MGAFDLVANPDAARAQNAAVVIHDEPVVRGIDGDVRVLVGEADMRYAMSGREVLQVAMAIGHADRADVIPLGEEQFQRHPPVLLQAFAGGLDFHALGHFRGAGGQELVAARDLREAQAAGTYVVKTFKVTEGWDVDAGFGGGLENRFVLLGANRFAVNGECFYSHEIVRLVCSRLRLVGFDVTGFIQRRIRLEDGEIFVPKITQGAGNGIGRRLAQPAKAGITDHVA